MQNRRAKNIKGLSSDLNAKVFSFLDSKHIPAVSRVCKDWKKVLELNPNTVRTMVGLSVSIPQDKISQLPLEVSKLKKEFEKYKSYQSKQNSRAQLEREIKKDTEELVEFERQMREQVPTTYRAPVPHSSSTCLMTREVQAVGCLTGFSTAGVAALVSYLTCGISLPCVVSGVGGYTMGYITGSTVKTQCVALRNEKNRIRKENLDRNISSIEMPLLTQTATKEERKIEVTETDMQDSSLYFRLM